jgi:NADPH:quinone reductase-like Zn-dependent oxidoreductase
MKAIQYSKLGGPEVLQYIDVTNPVPQPHEILIRVLATSINHIDIHFRRGLPSVTSPLPHIPGSDAVGVIEQVGSDVQGFKKGDTIVMDPTTSCGECEFCQKGMVSYCPKTQILGRETNGAYAELMALPAENAILLPQGFSVETAAAAPLVYLTAWSMVVTKGQVQSGQTVLVMGAGSGVGSAAIQIAQMHGAKVFTTAGSDEKIQKAKELLRVDQAWNYNQVEIDREVRTATSKKGVDLIIDSVGGKQWVPLLKSTKNGGTIVTCGATDGFDPKEDLRHIFYRQLRILGSTMGNHEEMKTVMSHVFDGRLKPIVDKVFPLKDAALAHQYVQDRKVFGKVILKP